MHVQQLREGNSMTVSMPTKRNTRTVRHQLNPRNLQSVKALVKVPAAVNSPNLNLMTRRTAWCVCQLLKQKSYEQNSSSSLV